MAELVISTIAPFTAIRVSARTWKYSGVSGGEVNIRSSNRPRPEYKSRRSIYGYQPDNIPCLKCIRGCSRSYRPIYLFVRTSRADSRNGIQYKLEYSLYSKSLIITIFNWLHILSFTDIHHIYSPIHSVRTYRSHLLRSTYG